MIKNIIVGLGNTGFNIVEACITRGITDTKYYAIDSQTSHVNMKNITAMTYIPIIADDKSGSGRNRERGKALYQFNEANGAFDAMYQECKFAKSPVIVITSSAGGTGSGSVVPFCDNLIKAGVSVIPIIICPNNDDPTAYHLNTEDLMMELDEVGVSTYSIFVNLKGDADYTAINNDVVEQIEIVFGKKYKKTSLDSIDDSDLDVVLSTPGRFMTVSAKAQDIPTLKKEVIRKLVTGFQPSFTQEDAEKSTFVTAFSLESPFANQDFKTVFEEVNSRIKNVYDEYKNIAMSDTAESEATIIIAGLPRPAVKNINTEFMEANTIGSGMKKNNRPSFIQKRKASTKQEKDSEGNVLKKFKWD